MKKNLKDISKRPNHKELSRKGGYAKTKRKAFTSSLNGMLSSNKLSSEKAYLLTCLQQGRFLDLLKELISMDIDKVKDEKVRKRVSELLVKLIPQKTIILNLENENENNEKLSKIYYIICDVCNTQQIERITELIKNEKLEI